MSPKEWAAFILERLSSIFTKAAVTGSVLLLLLWMSVFLYGTFYYAYIPPTSHKISINFEFNSECEGMRRLCSFPSSNISFTKGQKSQLNLQKGQPYGVLLELEMPESDINQKIGMFMINMHFYSRSGIVVQSSAKSTVLHYRSDFLRTLSTIAMSPLLIFGWKEEKQMLVVELFNKYLEDAYKPTNGAFIQIQSKHAEIYEATLHMHAIFSGLRYFLYHWPLTSAVVGILANFTFMITIAAFAWYQFIWKASPAEKIVPTIDLVEDDDPQVKKDKIKKVLGLQEDENLDHEAHVESIGTENHETLHEDDSSKSNDDILNDTNQTLTLSEQISKGPQVRQRVVPKTDET